MNYFDRYAADVGSLSDHDFQEVSEYLLDLAVSAQRD